MSGDRVERRLAAILAADVAGYSRLMGADEEGTHERLQAHLRELINPKISEHRGRIVKNTGDGFLAEFQSVVDAVRCAVEVQRGMADREPEVPEERRIRFRMGINLGDVIAEEHDIFGDGVNVAARLEALAEPGGICVSRVVRDQVRDRLDYAFEDLGEQQVKNIARPVRVYRVGDRARPIAQPLSAAPSALPLPDKPSIAVLPFSNMSSDPEQESFADGIAEVDADAELDQLFRSYSGVALGHPSLHLHRAAHRADHARELSEKAVTGVLDDAAVMFGDFGVDQYPEMRFQPFVRPLLIRPH